MFAQETEPTLVADGVVRLGTELVNWYLVEDGGRVTIVDAGAPKYRPQLDRGLALLGRRPADVAAVLLTSGHADRIGFAEPVRRELGVPCSCTVAIHTPGHTTGHGEPWTQGAGDAVRRARETGPT